MIMNCAPGLEAADVGLVQLESGFSHRTPHIHATSVRVCNAVKPARCRGRDAAGDESEECTRLLIAEQISKSDLDGNITA
jgi:hypothetical protein